MNKTEIEINNQKFNIDYEKGLTPSGTTEYSVLFSAKYLKDRLSSPFIFYIDNSLNVAGFSYETHSEAKETASVIINKIIQIDASTS